MKKLLMAILIGTATSGYCKSGGWLFDILDRSSITINSGYYAPTPCYYQQPRVIYYQQPAPVYYQSAPVYYQSAPVYYQQSHQNGYYYSGRGCR